mmetsp:Transcript_8461/g.14549  ORF Transcript_8461/g.14549 Transcript_8461/m.14549 type:complete len:174 (+) Transcript_8461:114-635(+)
MSVPIAVIPIAGLGTRLYPTTKVVPKAFFPVPDPKDGFVKPVIQLIIEEALSAEVEEICIVCSPKQEPEIRKYFNSDEVDAIKKKPDLNAQALRIADISHRYFLRLALRSSSPAHSVHSSSGCVSQFKKSRKVSVMQYSAPKTWLGPGPSWCFSATTCTSRILAYLKPALSRF